MITKRGKIYRMRRRVPGRYESVEMRKQIWMSLKTDSKSVALRKASAIWGELI